MPGATTYAPLDLTMKRVAITAAAGGIGRVICDGFSMAGASVFITDVDQEALTTTGRPHLRADAGKPDEMDAFMAAAIEHLGGLDILINNAGIAGPTKRVEELTPEEVEETLRIDLMSMFSTARRAVPALREAGRGSIINISSAAGRFGFAMRTPYAAAKWGVVGLTKSMAIELGPDNIRVNTILPGLVEGQRIRNVIAAKAAAAGVSEDEQTEKTLATTSLRTFVTQHDIANMALYLSSQFGATISGQAIAIDGDMQMLV